MIKKNDYTPWGKAQEVTQIFDNIWMIETASHGGLYIADELASIIPQSFIDNTFLKYRNWYEEDCDLIKILQWLGLLKEFLKMREEAMR